VVSPLGSQLGKNISQLNHHEITRTTGNLTDQKRDKYAIEEHRDYYRKDRQQKHDSSVPNEPYQ